MMGARRPLSGGDCQHCEELHGQKVQITHVSDLSGEEIGDTDKPSVTFGWSGAEYTIDLAPAEAEQFRQAISPYLSAATRVGKVKRTTVKRTRSSSSTAAEARAWAKERGYDVPDRGRIPVDVRKASEGAR